MRWVWCFQLKTFASVFLQWYNKSRLKLLPCCQHLPIRLIAMCRECQDNSNIMQKYSCILTFTPRPSLILYFSSKQVTPVIAEEEKSASSYNKRSSLRRSGRLSGATTPVSSPLSVSLSRQLTTEAADSIPHNKSVNEVEIERDTDYTEMSGRWFYLSIDLFLLSLLVDFMW